MGGGPAHIPAFLFANLITSVAYGIACTLFVKAIGIILRKRRSTGKLNLPLVVPSVLIFIFATVNLIGLWVNIYMAFVVNATDVEAYLGLIRTPAKTVIQTGQLGAILLADALVVYRTFIVWNHNYYVIVIPCMTFVATFISGAYFVTLQHRTDIQTSVFSETVTQWTVAFLLSSLATTVYSTGIIAFKLLRAQMQLRKEGVLTTGAGIGRRILRILAESAALYSLIHLLYAALYEVENQVEITPSFLEASVASITCSLIIVRSERANHRSQPFSTSAGSDTVITTAAGRSLADDKYTSSHDGKPEAFALHSMEVNVDISRAVMKDDADRRV